MVERSILEIETRYYEILERYYAELYEEYLKCGKNKSEAIEKYRNNQPNLYIPGNKDYLTYKRKNCIEEINDFWNDNIETVANYILSIPSVGIFGVGDGYSREFHNEISRNALFYDVIVLNDPFKKFNRTHEFEMKQNELGFYYDVLNVMDIKKYVVSSNNRQFVVLVPLDSIITEDENKQAFREAQSEGDKYVKEIFGLGKGELWEDIKLMKELSLEDAQEKLFAHGMYLDLAEAMNYSQDLLSEEEKRAFERLCFELWGNFNRDFLRCVLMKQAIPGIATTLFYGYKMHIRMATHLKSNPILGRNEWMPVKREVANMNYKASDEYLFCCSVHRNDKMQELVWLSPEEILDLRNRDDPKSFRRFFHEVTEDMYFTYADLDGISSEVYRRFDDVLDKEIASINKNKRKNIISSVIGMLKGALGFVPLLSYALSVYDIGASGADLSNKLNQKETMIEHIGKRKNI